MEMVQHVSIVGAGGRMGSWFLEYFSKKSRTRVSAYDKQALRNPPRYVTLCHSLEVCVSEADVVLVCVPLASTPSIVKECALSMKHGAVLAEISSIKSKTFLTLKKYSKNILPLCMHPMFGPGASRLSRTRILLIPVRDAKLELQVLSSLMRGSEIIILPSARVHDRYMALILGLTYFVNMIFAKILSKKDIMFLENISGAFFRIQLLLMQGIISDDPSLINSIISCNPYTEKYISEYFAEANKLRKMIRERKDVGLSRDLLSVKSVFGQSIDLQMSYRKIYATFGK